VSGVVARVGGSGEEVEGGGGRNSGGGPEGRHRRGNLRGDGGEEGLVAAGACQAGGDGHGHAGRDDGAVSDGWQLGHGLRGVDNHLEMRLKKLNGRDEKKMEMDDGRGRNEKKGKSKAAV